MTVKLLAEQNLEFLSFKGGCTCSSESTVVKMPYCLKSHLAAYLSIETFVPVIVVILGPMQLNRI